MYFGADKFVGVDYPAPPPGGTGSPGTCADRNLPLPYRPDARENEAGLASSPRGAGSSESTAPNQNTERRKILYKPGRRPMESFDSQAVPVGEERRDIPEGWGNKQQR